MQIQGITCSGSDIARFWKYVLKTSGCWLWIGTRSKGGYGTFTLHQIKFRAHRFAWMLAHGDLPADTSTGAGGTLICHSCDVPACVREEHLFRGDQAANMADMHSKNRWVARPQHGEFNPQAKIVEGDVLEIRRLAVSGNSQSKIGAQFNITQSQVSMILSRRRWAHL